MKPESEGFTLIELIAVIALISIIAAIVLPRIDPFVPERRLKSAARTLSGTISLAYGEAIAKKKTYRLYLDSSTDEYWIAEVQETDDEQQASAVGIRIGTQFELLQQVGDPAHTSETTPTEPLLAPKKLPEGVHFSSVEVVLPDPETSSSGPQYIEFNPLGYAGAATIQLTNDDGQEFTVRYDGVTGIPTLIPHAGEIG
ncbi:MAG: prepilin-type N-terminal cleavage/methylation domain-containing protein [Candidatus Abyssobacteria bacterium SURF_17]|jgi:prepilin-type N-terminal cleavage/methylation domain-containing protein|uniref:Type II secretion system protein H n=1 Tax=Candidatus Abyssobacteria bacterium SURF_17 TaxID=2093361 RepID=A0A419EMW7_9BACT|nr:MAG: prepilin-type N-terminal cleavage/methylation domain-containing protein [Candidatus Abyssubacteria bacterium SURF_17]